MTKVDDNLFPKIILQEAANDGSDFSNPPADYRVAFLGEDGLWHVKDSAGTVSSPYSGGSGGGLLAVKAYAPGSDTTIGTTSSTTLVDVDATNLGVTFTAPASGNVIVRLSALTGPTSSASPAIRWGVRESSSIVAGPNLIWPVSSSAAQYFTADFYLTGVSAGSHTYKFALATSANTSAVYGGPTYGKATIQVWSAP